MNIAITGANGYLGSALTQRLLTQLPQSFITAIVRTPDQLPRYWATLPAERVRIVKLADVITGQVSLQDIDILCHLAACRSHDKPMELAVMLDTSANLFQRAVDAEVGLIINSSTHTVYGGTPTPWRETDRVSPHSNYGMAKYATELLLQMSTKRKQATRGVSLRIAKLVGPSPNFRVSPTETPHFMGEAALKELRMTLPNEGRQLLDLLDIRDAIDAFIQLFTVNRAKLPAVLNLGSGQTVSMAGVAERVATISKVRFGKAFQYDLDSGAKPLRNFGMATELINHTLCWQPRHNLDTTIMDVMDLLSETAFGN